MQPFPKLEMGSKFSNQNFQLSLVTVDEEHGYSQQCSASKLQRAAQFYGVFEDWTKRPIGGSLPTPPPIPKRRDSIGAIRKLSEDDVEFIDFGIFPAQKLC